MINIEVLKSFELDSIIFFGSYAYGTLKEGSDIRYIHLKRWIKQRKH